MSTRERSRGTVLITGGSSGLGAAIASEVADRGGTPIVLDRQSGEGPWRTEQVDLADSTAADAIVRRVVDEVGGVDAVVTCAGIDVPGSLLDVPAATWERIVAVNLFGTAAVVRASLPSLLERNGAIVTVASTLGHRAVGDGTAYCASKFGVVGFTRALMAEYRGRGLDVTLVTPGGMQTAFFDERDERYRPASDARLARPRDVATAVLFALDQPPGLEIKELVVTGPDEQSWP